MYEHHPGRGTDPPGDLLARALGEFRAALSGAESPGGSGAGVRSVRTAAGDPAYLKTTTAGPGLAAGRRELRFYRELAPTTPVRTPPLLGFLDDAEGVAILLGAAGRPVEAGSWSPGLWARLGRDLAALHDAPLPADPYWAARDPAALRRGSGDPAVARRWSGDPGGTRRDSAAPRRGSGGGGPSTADTGFWAGRLPGLDDLVADGARLRAATTALPPVRTHGDCHAANLLHDGGSLTFCDWQSTGVGRPSADLAFLSVRATPSGSVVPPDLLDAYATARGCDRAVLGRAVLAEELTVFLAEWPAYARFQHPDGLDRVVRRTRLLARRWLAG
ncbi:MAG TPA: phosphotransferase [Mycobacteriales bacterium]|jgi:hypothetical protein|nr:phosphotransferase [Mycobacteriales bacterium]